MREIEKRWSKFMILFLKEEVISLSIILEQSSSF